MGYTPSTPAAVIRDDPAARAIFDRYLPGALSTAFLGPLRRVPVGALVKLPAFGRLDDASAAALWSELAAAAGSAPPDVPEPPAVTPRADYQTAEVPRGSAPWRLTSEPTRWGVLELTFDGPSHGNPFTDVELSAVFTDGAGADVGVGGFYDGDGTYRVRFCPPTQGAWSFRTQSTARSLDDISGSVLVEPPATGHRGPVAVADTFHFRYADGTRCLPVGTTVYAWTHQDRALEQRTLQTLVDSGFRKLRFCVFPKWYLFNTDEPPRFPFVRLADGDWDFTRFDPAYFRHLEQRIAELQVHGIEADLILFHPYDRWGFSEMPRSADDRYVQYVVRRLSAYANVWWSLANEYDLVLAKVEADWERLARVVSANDHAGHLTSIHNCFRFFDHTRPWITHVSAQRTDVYRTAENTDQWRREYGKPVVVDECGYEGDLDQGWGNISGRELVRRMWEGAVRGGYVGHGETYLNEREELFWSKGGTLVGEAPERIRFLIDVCEAAPAGVLEPLPSDWDVPWAGQHDYRVGYFGFSRPRYRDVNAPPGRWVVDVLDTWAMTVDRLPGTFEGSFRVPLPGREYMAIRLTQAR